MLAPALIALTAILAVLVVRLRARLGDARAKAAALEALGGRERKRLLDQLGQACVAGDRARAELQAAQERLSVLDPAPSLVGKTLAVTDRELDLTLRGVVHAQHADRWTFRDAVFATPAGDEPAGGLVHVLVGNIGPTQEITDELARRVTPLRAVEEQ